MQPLYATRLVVACYALIQLRGLQDLLKGRCWSAGFRLAAVSDQHGKSRRTLFAVFIQELSGLSERELAQQLLTLLKHLPLIGTAH